MDDFIKTTEIFRGSSIESMGIMNLLESNGIPVYEDSALMATIEPFAVSPGGFGSSIIKVAQEDYDKALKVIEDYNNGVNEIGDDSVL
jgi:hypothetical protein